MENNFGGEPMGGGRGKKESGGEMMSEVHCTQYNYM
jgi:hypothetical protein